MADEYQILRIEDSISAVGQGQIGVTPSAHAVLGRPAWGGKDYAGNVTLWAGLDLPARFATLQLTSLPAETGVLQHDAVGNVFGGKMDLATFNTYITDADLGESYWERDAGGWVYPAVSGDVVVAGDGTAAIPSYSFESAPDNGLGLVYGNPGIILDGEPRVYLAHTGDGRTSFYGFTDAAYPYFRIGAGGNDAAYTPIFELSSSCGPDAPGSRIMIDAEANFSGQQAGISQLAHGENAFWSAEAHGDGGGGSNTTLVSYGEGNSNLEFHCTSTGTGGIAWVKGYARAYDSVGGTAHYYIAAEDPTLGNTSLELTSQDGIFALQSKGNYLLNIQYVAGTEIRNQTEYFVLENEHLSASAGGTFWLKNFVDGSGNMYIENDGNGMVYSLIRASGAESGNLSLLIISADGGTGGLYELDITTSGDSGGCHVTLTHELYFDDSYRSASTWTDTDGIPLAVSATEWTNLRTLIGGDGSIIAGILAAAGAAGSVSLDSAYNGGTSITVDAGTVAMTVPGAGTDVALTLSNLNSGNTSEALGIYHQATLSTGYAIYMSGAQGGSGTDYLEMGHSIWTPGSMTIGHGTGSGDEIRRSYTTYHYRDDAAVPWAAAEMRAEADTAYAQYASIVCRAGNYGGVSANIDLESTAYISLDAAISTTIETGTGALTLDAGSTLRFVDANRSGSGWASSYINLSASGEWDTLEAVIGSEGTIFGGIIAAASPLVVEGASEGASYTTSGSYVQKLRVTTPSLVSGQGYLIIWSYEIGADAENDIHTRTQINDTTTIGEGYYDNDPYASRFRAVSGSYYSDTLSGAVNIDIDYYRAYGSGQVFVQRARIIVLRVSMN